MTRVFIVIKRKGGKNPIGAIPANVTRVNSKKKLMMRIKKRFGKRFVFKIISETQFRKAFSRLIRRKAAKRKTRRKKKR